MDARNFESGAIATAPTKPVTPSVGYPTNGNGTTVPPTVPGDFVFYKMLEEMQNVIVGAGLTPSDDELDQFSQAIALMLNPISKYESSEQVIVSGGSITLAHGLGATPFGIDAFLICKIAEAGYIIDDKINVSTADFMATSFAHDTGVGFKIDVANITAKYGSGGDTGSTASGKVFFVIDGTTGNRAALTNNNWRLIVRAWK